MNETALSIRAQIATNPNLLLIVSSTGRARTVSLDSGSVEDQQSEGFALARADFEPVQRSRLAELVPAVEAILGEVA